MLPYSVIVPVIWGALISILSYSYCLGLMKTKTSNYALGAFYILAYYTSYYLYRFTEIFPYLTIWFVAVLFGVSNFALYQFLKYKINEDHQKSHLILTVTFLLIAAGGVFFGWIRDRWFKYSMTFLMKDGDFKLFNAPGVMYVSLVFVLIVILMDRKWIQQSNPKDSWIWFSSGALTGIAGGLAPLWFMGSFGLQPLFVLVSMMAGTAIASKKCMWSLLGGFVVGYVDVAMTMFAQETYGVRAGEYRFLISGFILIGTYLVRSRLSKGQKEDI